MGKRVVTYVSVRESKGQVYADVHGFDFNPVGTPNESGYKGFQLRGGRGLSKAALSALSQLAGRIGFHVCDVDMRETQFGATKGVELSDFSYVGPMSDYEVDAESGALVKRGVAAPAARPATKTA